MFNSLFVNKRTIINKTQKSLSAETSILLVFCCALGFMLSGINSNLSLLINSLLIPVIWLILLKTEYFEAMIFPLAFVYNYYGLSFGVISILWIYFILCFLKYIIIKRSKLSINNLLILVIFGGLQLIFPVSGIKEEGLKYLGFLFCILYYYSNNRNRRDFNPIYINIVAFCIASALMPLIGLSQTRVISLIDGIFRYSAGGIHDPNYSSFFMTIGVISALCSNNMHFHWWKYIRVFSIALFLFTILRSLSLTGILGVAVVIIMYILYQPKFQGKLRITFTIILLLLAIAFSINNFFPNVLESLNWRLDLIASSYYIGDYNAVSSNRLYLLNLYWDYFWKQDFLHIFLGFHSIPSKMLINWIGGVTHNSYLDMIFMYGIVGTLLLLIALVRKIFRLNIENNKRFDTRNVFIILCSVSLMYFSSAISILPTVQWIVIYYLRRD